MTRDKTKIKKENNFNNKKNYKEPNGKFMYDIFQ